MSYLVEDESWQNFGLRLAINSIAHPIEYAKVLMQIGYEPLPAYPSTSLFGRPTHYLPNVFQYVAYIKSIDGFTGCFRGLGPKLCSNVVSAVAFQKTAVAVSEPNVPDKAYEEMTDDERLAVFIRNLTRDICARAAAVTASQPFNVIAIRMMAQFVGGETKYTGIFGSVIEVYRTDGISGFFSGFAPRLIGELLSLVLAATLTYSVNRCIAQDRELRTYTSAVMSLGVFQYIASALTYPFVVVSNTMTVNNCGLSAGLPPHMPIYNSWTDCWKQLSKSSQLKRGGSLIFRCYVSQLPVASTTSVKTMGPFNPSETKKSFFSFNPNL